MRPDKEELLSETILSACSSMFLLFAMLVTGSARAELVDQGYGLVYDSVQDITWLANANLPASESFGITGITVNGEMTWFTTQDWMQALNDASYLGTNQWRLPYTPQNDPTCSDTVMINDQPVDFHFECRGSEMGHLFYEELSGVSDQSVYLSNDPDLALFQNIAEYYYWSIPLQVEPNLTWSFPFSHAYQSPRNQYLLFNVWPVHDGNLRVLLADGDINTDGQFDLADLVRAFELLMNNLEASDSEMLHGDVAPQVDGVSQPDGIFNLGDVVVLTGMLMAR